MVLIMASLAERDQIIWSIPSGLTALNVVNIQPGIFALAMAVPAGVVIAPEYILPNIPEAKLIPLLVLFALDIRVLNPLNIELGRTV